MGALNYTWSVGSQTTAAISVTPNISQVYNVVGTNAAGCSTNSNVTVFIVTCTGLDNQVVTQNTVKVYPNPTAGEFTIEFANGLNKTIEIIDLSGRVVLVTDANEDKVNLNIANLANGIYSVKVRSNNSVEVLKLVKE